MAASYWRSVRKSGRQMVRVEVTGRGPVVGACRLGYLFFENEVDVGPTEGFVQWHIGQASLGHVEPFIGH
jgi:hypothetical protein